VNLGREALAWSQELWSDLDKAVHEEMLRTAVSSRLLPVSHPPASAATVPADVIDPATMTIDDGGVLQLLELSAEFSLTQAQVDAEPALGTARSLATRAANLLARAEDLVVLQGEKAREGLPEHVSARGPLGPGLLASGDPLSDRGEATSARMAELVAEAYGRLQANGRNGPYALALSSGVFAEMFAPLNGSPLTPADRIRPLVEGAFVGTGALPPANGVLVSLGAEAIEIVVTQDPVTAFVQANGDGLFRFRVLELIALRIRDPESVVPIQLASR
jgi:uncharacterized linocin/CFP29 family protein